MKVKVSEATGPALNWMVAKCLTISMVEGGVTVIDGTPYYADKSGMLRGAFFSDNWSQGGPIIEREQIETSPWDTVPAPDLSYPFRAVNWRARTLRQVMFDAEGIFGTTPLIAAMRCYVASKMGDEVDIPKELV